MNCSLCHQPVDPTSRSTYRRVQGWERRAISASRKSGSDIVAREQLEQWAHANCVERLRSGIPIAQVELL